MTAKQILNLKSGQKVGLGNGLRCVCDGRNGARYFELRKRVRGRGLFVGCWQCRKPSPSRGATRHSQRLDNRLTEILDLIAAGADPAGIGKSARSTRTLTGRSPLRDVGKQYVADKGDEWSSEDVPRQLPQRSGDSLPLADGLTSRGHQSGYGHRGHPTRLAHQDGNGIQDGKAAVSPIQLRHREENSAPTILRIGNCSAMSCRRSRRLHRYNIEWRWTIATALPCSPSCQRTTPRVPRRFSG